jgi:hypothetical protein
MLMKILMRQNRSLIPFYEVQAGVAPLEVESQATFNRADPWTAATRPSSGRARAVERVFPAGVAQPAYPDSRERRQGLCRGSPPTSY